MADIFISYAREDRQWAEMLSKAFEAQGWSVWWDRRISAGEEFSQVIEQSLHEARCVIVLWSKASVKSRWVRDEANEGLERGILVPLNLDGTKPPMGFRSIHATSIAGWKGKSSGSKFEMVLYDVSRVLGPAQRETRPSVGSKKDVYNIEGPEQKHFGWTISWSILRRNSVSRSIVGVMSVLVLATFFLWEPLGFNVGPTDGGTTPPDSMITNGGTTRPDTTNTPETPPAPIVTFTGSEVSIVRGESMTLNWSTTHATDVRILPEVGVVDTTGSQNITPNTTTTYRLVARGLGGDVEETLTIRVTDPPLIPTPIALFTADPDEIEQGESATLNWSTSNASAVRIDQGIGRVGADGSRRVSPTSTTTYTLTAAGEGESTTKQVRVTVKEPEPIVVVAAPFTNSIGMKFMPIKANSFLMGSNNGDDDEQPVHTVRITKDFYMAETEVTQGQWKQVMGDTPSGFKKGDNHPVESVTWDRVQEFITEMNRRDRQYRYRLPTEAEWEFACRAGSTTEYSYGDDVSLLDRYAVYGKDRSDGPDPVKSKRPNAWGLYDMMGNVWEWTEDWYAAGYYGNSSPSDPKGPGSGSSRVLRGGSFVDMFQ